ncbi:MAG: DUF2341 domain-containing protein [Thermoplasmatales archaeon]|nr:MAG: DUF2341 domain-containing protein [Thermoplasmatales archaeon]
MAKEKIQKIETIHGEIDSDGYQSPNRIYSDKSSFNRVDNIDYLVDRVLIKHKVPSYTKRVGKKYPTHRRRRYRGRRKVRNITNKRLHIKKILAVALALFVVLAAIPYILPPVYGDFGSDVSVSLSPENIFNNDTMFVNVTIPDVYNVTSVSADMAGVDVIDLMLVDNSTPLDLWQGVWFVHDVIPGEHIVTIVALDMNNTSYSTGVRLSVLPEEIPDDNQSLETGTNGTSAGENVTIISTGLNLALQSDKLVYVINESVLISGVVSYNNSLINTSASLLIAGSDVNLSDVANVSEGSFDYEFVPDVAGDYTVLANVSYMNESTEEVLVVSVISNPVENVTDNISEVSIIDPVIDEKVYVVPGTSFFVERTISGLNSSYAIFAPMFSSDLSVERFEIIGENKPYSQLANSFNEENPIVFAAGKGKSLIERRIDILRNRLPLYIRSLDSISYSRSIRLDGPITVRIWFKTPSWEDIKTGRSSPSGKISYLLLSTDGNDFDFEGSTWWNANWGNRKLITINSSQVVSDLINFPVLIYESSDSDLASDAQENGDDIAFIQYSDNTTQLNHEIALFNNSTGQIAAWVNVTSLSSSVDTKIWMYYNNSACSSQENVANTWDSDYEIIWHLQEDGNGTTDEYKDSSSNACNGTGGKDDDSGGLGDATETPDRVNGKFGYAQDFNVDGATGDRISSQDLSSAWSAVTGSVWIYGNAAGDDRLWGKSWGGGLTDNTILMRCTGTGANTLGCRFRTDTSNTNGYQPASMENNQWIYVVLTWDGSDDDTVRIYKNGVLQGSGLTVSGSTLYGSPPHEFFTLGNVGDGAENRCFDGYIQEARMSSIRRNISWINTEYNNQNNLTTFLNFDSEETYTGKDTWNLYGTDIVSPWNWTFNFPNGTGYYEFYSIGRKSGSPNETNPDNADAICKYNILPIITNEGPSNGSTNVPLTPQMNITINDLHGETMTIIWYSNSSGTWQVFGTNTSVNNGTYHQTNTNYSNTGKTYWWYVTVNDELDTNTSATFHFTTIQTAAPQVTTNISTGVEENNATLRGYLYDEGGESCTVRFEYGTTTNYGTNTSNQTKNTNDEFSTGIGSLSPGQLYHYRAFANNTYGSDTGSDSAFLTKPQPPTSLTAQSNNSNTIYLTWTIGTGANTTYIEYNTTANWPRNQGSEIYNSTGTSYEHSSLSQGTTYYYQVWSYTNWTYDPTLHQWSDSNASASNKTNNIPTAEVISPANGSTGVNLQSLCQIWANDSNGDTLAVFWYENSSGSWVLRQTNTSVSANSTLNWTFNQANAYGTTYWWRVAINDSIDNATFWFYFTTEVLNTSVDTITPYEVLTSPLTITASNVTPVDNVTLWYRYTSDNSTWWNESWTSRMKLTVNSSQVDDDLANFPILVNITSTNLSNKAQADGDDIVFTNATGTKLNHEIENYTSGTGNLIAWVNLTSVISSSDTDIYIYYGNSRCSDQQNQTGVWDHNYVGVWHLDEEESGTGNIGLYNDSTSKNNHGDDYVSDTGQLGQINGGQQFDGNGDYISVPHHSSLDLRNEMTISFWVYPTQNTGQWNRIVEKGLFGYQTSYYFGGGGGTNDLTFYLDNTEVFDTVNNVLQLNEWQHCAVNYSSSGDSTLFLNGTSIDSGSYTGSITGNSDVLYISFPQSTYDFPGYIDEVRISNISRNASWINTCYNNQNNQSTFISMGNEEAWMEWDNSSQNPDTASPWSWDFDFPNSTGYYEFYSIGNKSGSPNETAPNTADAICHWIENTSINVTPSQWNQGDVLMGSSNVTTGFYFNLTHEGNIALSILIKASNATNATTGAEWKLNSTPGHDNFSVQYNLSGGGSWTNINTTFNTFVTNLAIDSWQTFDLNLIMATSTSKNDPLSFTITFKSVAS